MAAIAVIIIIRADSLPSAQPRVRVNQLLLLPPQLLLRLQLLLLRLLLLGSPAELLQGLPQEAPPEATAAAVGGGASSRPHYVAEPGSRCCHPLPCSWRVLPLCVRGSLQACSHAHEKWLLSGSRACVVACIAAIRPS